MMASEKFERGVAYFNARKFFEAHEAWEKLWLGESGPEKSFLQGLIQIAAAFHHYSRGNSRGAKSLLAAGISKLGPFPSNHRGLAVKKLRTETSRWLRLMGREEGPGPVPKIRALTQRGGSRARSKQRTPRKKSPHA
jgi:predicted metal-dependent hydrolase